jgi:hypothetical protein
VSALRLADLAFPSETAAWAWLERANDAELIRVAGELGLEVDPADPGDVLRRVDRALADAMEERETALNWASY